jgi:site-specific DNA-methyltransferase (adenine-specific)
MKTNVLHFGNNLSVLRERIADKGVNFLYNALPFNSNRNFFALCEDRTGRDSMAQEEAFIIAWSWTEES